MADDIDRELAYEEEIGEKMDLTTEDRVLPRGFDRVNVADEPSNAASSDTADAHPEKRLRTERGAISRPARKPDDAKCPTLLSATLTKHSAKFSPLPPIDEPVANMDHYRDAMLLDKFPGADGPAWYIWTRPEH